MIDEIWKDFFTDYQTRRVMNNSEVWRNYSQAELARDEVRTKRAQEQKLDEENNLLDEVEAFRQKVDANPALKAKLKQAADYLEEYPELKEKVDPSFLHGLELIDFGED